MSENWYMSGRVDPDQKPNSVVSDLGLHCLHKPVQILRVNKVGNYFPYFSMNTCCE